MKTIDKYQLNEDTSFDQDGISAYLAVHTVLKKKYMVKMLTLNTQREKQNSNYLTKECQILKKMVHESVYRCYKLLRSKNNLYAVYDSIEGKSLQQLLKQELAFEHKANILKQLIQLLIELQSRNIVGLNIRPSNVVVQENYKITVKNFGMAEEFNNEQREKDLKSERAMVGEYVPPEIRQGKIYRNSDLYSFGMLINALFANQLNKMESFKQRVALCLDKYGINVSLSIQNIKKIITDLTNKSSKERSNLKELLTTKKNLLAASPEKSEKCLSSISRVKSKQQITQPQYESINISRSISYLSTSEERHRQKIDNYTKLLEIILKKRGLTMLMLQVSQAVLTNKEVELTSAIQLSFMLVKKATIMISQLAKLLSKGFNLEYFIQQKQLLVFQKQQTYQLFLDLINSEMKQTQQKFQHMLGRAKKMVQISKNEQLQQETKSQSVDQVYLKKVILQFLLQLHLITTDGYVSQFQNDSLYYIYIVSLLADFKSLEEIYECFFSQQVAKIEDQPFYKQLVILGKVKVVELLQKNTTKLYSQTSGSFDLSVRTTKTPKMLKTKSFK